ncbi:hypothetical protein J6590_050426 [Homalodisca vitripennis]|nr:hypothetical protein J6590_050426 [Homalodisca vitripennis]
MSPMTLVRCTPQSLCSFTEEDTIYTQLLNIWWTGTTRGYGIDDHVLTTTATTAREQLYGDICGAPRDSCQLHRFVTSHDLFTTNIDTGRVDASERRAATVRCGAAACLYYFTVQPSWDSGSRTDWSILHKYTLFTVKLWHWEKLPVFFALTGDVCNNPRCVNPNLGDKLRLCNRCWMVIDWRENRQVRISHLIPFCISMKTEGVRARCSVDIAWVQPVVDNHRLQTPVPMTSTTPHAHANNKLKFLEKQQVHEITLNA